MISNISSSAKKPKKEDLKSPRTNRKYAMEGLHEYINPLPRSPGTTKHVMKVSEYKRDCRKCKKKSNEMLFTWTSTFLIFTNNYYCPECADY